MFLLASISQMQAQSSAQNTVQSNTWSSAQSSVQSNTAPSRSTAQSSGAEEESCCQPGRIESAKHILAQAEKFKLKASESHVDLQKAINGAALLKAQASTLAKLPPGSLDMYRSSLNDFTQHAAAYRAHLADLEKQIGTCHANDEAYQAQLKEYAMHVGQFHMPDIPTPHICHSLQVSEGAASHMANSMRADMQRLAASEDQLARAENRLANAVADSVHQDESLLKRSDITEGERNLASEFASLKTEYQMLNIQHNALLSKGLKDPATIARVSGVVKPSAK